MAGAALQRAWLRRGPLALLMWPLSQLYALVTWGHRTLYRLGILRTEQAGVPVIVVGNVVAGGAGKTPVVTELASRLGARGLRVGVVSRGYGRTTADCRQATAGSSPADVGDEPVLVAARTGVPVFVAPRRIDAARALIAAYPSTQVIICDDGLQHHALARDVEICVFDERGTGNGWLLPAGPLRERWPRKVDLVLRAGEPAGIGGFSVQRRLAYEAVRADGQRIELASLLGQPCLAVAGIARPEAFFAMLRGRGLQLQQAIALPDHHDFDSAPVQLEDGLPVLCTEKDAVKLWRRHPGAWAVPLVLDIAPAFWENLDRLLEPKLSFGHGPETA